MINKKLMVGFTAMAALTVGLVGCGKKQDAKKAEFTAAMVTDGGSIDDKSFNQSSWEGLKAWGKEHDLKEGVNGFNYAQSDSDADFAPNLNKLAKANYKVVFGIGYKLKDAVSKAGKQFPKTKFVLIDDVITKQKNVASVTFQTEQSSFLAGVAAAKTTKTNRVGFVGGIETELIKGFESGFRQGVAAVNPKIKVDVKYAGSFTAADKGQSLATAMYNNNADVIFQAAGGTGLGVFTAAKNLAKSGKKVWVIGADKDQKADGKYAGGNVTLASATKEVGNAVQDIANKAMNNKFPGGKVMKYGLKSKGIALVNDSMSKEAAKTVKDFQTKIEDGSLKVKTAK